MQSHYRRLLVHGVLELAFQNRCYATEQLLPAATPQRAVRRVLHQRVLKGVLRMWRRSAPEDQLGVHELREGVIDLLLWHLCHGADQLVRERTPERRANLGDF